MKEESSQSNQIYFNKTVILNSLEKNGKYETDTTLIIRWVNNDYNKNNNNSEMFILKICEKINKEKIIFIGIINNNFKREGLCINNYVNGDAYFGYYLNDLRNKSGLYIYNPKTISNKINKYILYQYYFGLWKNDIKHEKGIYIWIKDELINPDLKNNDNINKIYNPFQNFEKSDLQAYVGNIDYNNFTKGALLKKEGNNFFIYFGTFSKELKKQGKNCFYYSSKLEELFYGDYENDIFKEGYVSKFDDKGKIKDIIYFKNKINKVNLEDKNIINIANKLVKFRNIIKTKNYFQILFNIFKEIIEFKNDKMNDIKIFNSLSDKQIYDISYSFNKETIFEDIENNLNNS